MLNDVICTMPCQFGFFFLETHAKTQISGFIICEAYACVYLPKSILASCKKRYGLMTHYIVTKKHDLNQPEIHYSKTLVNRILTKASKIHN